ncbi:unnamed protein product [Oppiella nova]|uniref:Bromodomain protein 4 C-terminal domain-containing protein n=1 Tax=Oppiella nova TaxID=334625 RepID=A0A7R9LCJ2_9ACAR|nr:unnamed protein product [Oppiella nova]CAG2162155.1 unnamed protein product [Oppiella nova]
MLWGKYTALSGHKLRESPKKKANTNKPMGQFAAPHSQHTPTFPGTLPITQSYNQSLSATLGPQVPQNQMFGNQSFNHPLPMPSGPSIAGGASTIVVASHSSLPQQPQRPTATATAAPTRKNILSAPGGPQLTPQPTHKNPPVPLNSNSDSNQSNAVRDSPKVNASHFTPPFTSTAPTQLHANQHKAKDESNYSANNSQSNSRHDFNSTNSGSLDAFSSGSPANGEKKEGSKSSSSMSQSSPSVMSNKKSNAFDAKSKGLSGWSSIASSGTGGAGANIKVQAENSFELFKKQAKEKQDKQNQLKLQQDLRRKTQEREEKERLRQEKERQREKEEDEALEKARKQHQKQQQIDEMSRNQSSNSSPASGSGSPSQAMSQSERERLRQREKERRMREARAQQIDLNRQSEVMATFEEML